MNITAARQRHKIINNKMHISSKTSEVDVLIIGAGPTGLMLTLWLAEQGISTRIVDKLGARCLNGHADGVQVRTVEIFESFDFADMLRRLSSPLIGRSVWSIDEDGKLRREKTGLIDDVEHKRTRRTTNQGRTESLIVDAITERSKIKVERGVVPIHCGLDEESIDDPVAFPITVTLQHLEENEIRYSKNNAHVMTGDRSTTAVPGYVKVPRFGGAQLERSDTDFVPSGMEGKLETVKAKYLVGTEGSQSWTRQQLGFLMDGDSKDTAWAVMDIIPITDFPDIRKLSTVVAKTGSLVNVPRENQLSRIYIQIPDCDVGKTEAVFGQNVNPIIEYANSILAPYTLEYKYCDWWSIFRVSRTVCEKYSAYNRIFLGGDAVHTHSPKMGQGMNVSMQDAYNLGWKLGGVLNGQYPRSILNTYEEERRPIAVELVKLDTELSVAMHDVADPTRINRAWAASESFQSGTNVQYASGTLVMDPSSQTVASAIRLGARMPVQDIRLLFSGEMQDTLSILKSDGHWNLFIFGGDLSDTLQLEKVNAVGRLLESQILSRYRLQTGARSDTSLINLRLVYFDALSSVEVSQLHESYLPYDDYYGRDWTKIHLDVRPDQDTQAPEIAGEAHKKLGIGSGGCSVLVRPDQHVAWVGGMADILGLQLFLDRFCTVNCQ